MARFAPPPGGVSRDIDSGEAWEAYQLGIPFLDARRSADFRNGHVRGAFPAPVWESDLPARLTAFEARVPWPYDAPLVLYCAGGDCEDSQLLAERMVALGYRNLLIYRGGWPDWKAQGRPADREAP
jgi:rhodanese-related sulfurtransferase